MESDQAILSFKLGPVQPFIEAARTLRDLWTGSYLLSWLAAHAMAPVIKRHGRGVFITPWVDDDNPLISVALGQGVGQGEGAKKAATTSCLPHTFAALVPHAEADELANACVRACQAEWRVLSDAAHKAIAPAFRGADPGWDRNWQTQIDSFFEFRCVALPLAEATPQLLEQLQVTEDKSQTTQEDALWSRRWNLAGALMDVSRSVRHTPAYAAQGEHGRFPIKCALLGNFEQMGPADLDASAAFWQAVSSPNWRGVQGTRLQASDRLCAISLVKRFAWPAYFANRLQLRLDELSYDDTATRAAVRWLPPPDTMPEIKDPEDDVDEGDSKVDWRKLNRWSGQWLHWRSRTQEVDRDERECPRAVWDMIQKRKQSHGPPPAYYAILHLDGDNMGDFFQGEPGKCFGFGVARFREISERLTNFSLESVRKIVEKHDGELIYAGGDDVLALLPTETAISCAGDLSEAFRAEACLGNKASLSGGIAVAHYKEDLRFALQTAREAEKAAKKIGAEHGDRKVKKALAITVCRRSGEHTTAVLGWEQTPLVSALINDFRGSTASDGARVRGASDRWAYKLRTELPTLRKLPLEAARAETTRLVKRGEAAPEGFADRVGKLFDAYGKEMKLPERNWPDEAILSGFVTLCQSASFLARGGD